MDATIVGSTATMLCLISSGVPVIGDMLLRAIDMAETVSVEVLVAHDAGMSH